MKRLGFLVGVLLTAGLVLLRDHDLHEEHNVEVLRRLRALGVK